MAYYVSPGQRPYERIPEDFNSEGQSEEEKVTSPVGLAFGVLPVGQVGSWMGIENTIARTLVDIVLDPIAIGAGLLTGGGAFFGSALTKIGGAARVAKGLTAGEKVASVVKAAEAAAGVAKAPHLGAAFRRAVMARDIKGMRSSLTAIQKVGMDLPSESHILLREMRSGRFKRDMENLFKIHDSGEEAIGKLTKQFPYMAPGGVIPRTGADLAIGELAETAADRIAKGQGAALMLLNPFTGSTYTLLKRPTFVHDLAFRAARRGHDLSMKLADVPYLGAAAAIPLTLYGVDRGAASIAPEAKAGHEALEILRTEMTKASDEAVSSMKTLFTTNPAESVHHAAAGFSAITTPSGAVAHAANMGSVWANSVQEAKYHSRRLRDTINAYSYAAAGAEPKSMWERMGYRLGFETDASRVARLTGEGIEDAVELGGAVEARAWLGNLESAASEAGMDAYDFAKKTLSEDDFHRFMRLQAVGKDQFDVASAWQTYAENVHKTMLSELEQTNLLPDGSRLVSEFGDPLLERTIGHVRNYLHSNVVLTAKGKELFKTDKDWAKALAKQILGDVGEKGHLTAGQVYTILREKKWGLKDLYRMEREGLLALTTRDPAAMLEQYHFQAAKTLLDNRLLYTVRQLDNVRDGSPAWVQLGDLTPTFFESFRTKEGKATAEAVKSALHKVENAGVKGKEMAVRATEKILALEAQNGVKYDFSFVDYPHPLLRNVAVHPQIAKQLHLVLDWPPAGRSLPDWANKAVGGAYLLNAARKSSLLAFSNFHVNNMLAAAIGIQGPHGLMMAPGRAKAAGIGAAIGGVAAGGIALAAGAGPWALGAGAAGALGGGLYGAGLKAASQGMALMQKDPDFMARLYSAGFQSGVPDPSYEALQDGLRRAAAVSGETVMGKGVRAVRTVNDVFQKGTFDYYYTGIKTQLAHELYTKRLEELQRLGQVVDEKKILKDVVAHLNTAVGGIDFRTFGLTPQMQRTFSMMLLAPNWTVTNLTMGRDIFLNIPAVRRFLVGAAMGAGAGAIFGMPLQGAVAGAAFGGATIPMQMMQKGMLSEGGEMVWRAAADKPLKERFSAALQAVDMSMADRSDLAKRAQRFMLISIGSMVTAAQALSWGLTGKFTWENEKGHETDVELPWKDNVGRRQYMELGKAVLEPFQWARDPFKTAYRKMAPLPKLGIQVLTNKDYRGAPIVAPSDGPMESTLKRAGYVAKSFVPISFQDVDGIALNGESPASFAVGMAGLPIRSGRAPKGALAEWTRSQLGQVERQTAPYYYRNFRPDEDYQPDRNQVMLYGSPA
jgi:hypothetical protein